MSGAILSAQHICKNFGSNSVLEDVSVDFYPGQVQALLGVNGAGKSTLVKILQGIHQPTGGSIEFNGETVVFNSPSEAMDRGIAMVFQELNLFNELSVMENILNQNYVMKNGMIDWDACKKAVRSHLEEYKIDVEPDAYVKDLPIAKQQLVEIAKCLYTKPKVVFLDEPSSSLSRSEEKILYDIIRNLKKVGIAVVLITHKMGEVFDVCDTLSILRDGHVVASGDVHNFNMDEIVNYMLGKSADIFKKSAITHGDPNDVMLEVSHLSIERKFSDISFQLHRGEIIAFAGLVGSGKSDLARTLFGIHKKYDGEIIFEGKNIHPTSPLQAAAYGIGHVPISRKLEGLLGNLDAKSNIVSATLDKIGFFANKSKEIELANRMMKECNVHPNDINLSVTSFSGGNQQKIVVSRWIAADKKLIILDEPTKGVDVGAKQEIYDNLRKLAEKGVGIILFSSETEELLSSSDRIFIMFEGKIIKELITAQSTAEEVLSYSVGGKLAEQTA